MRAMDDRVREASPRPASAKVGCVVVWPARGQTRERSDTGMHC